MYNDAIFVILPHRPEGFILGPVELEKTQARIGRVGLQVKGGDFNRSLFITGEFAEAVGIRFRRCGIALYALGS